MKTNTFKTILLILIIGFTFNISNAADCINFGAMSAPVGDYNNDSIYPGGSVFQTVGDLKFIKTKSNSPGPGPWNTTNIIYVTPNDLGYNGYLTFDVSSASYSCRELIFKAYAEKIIIGNDTLTAVSGKFSPYTGNGYVVDTLVGGLIKVTGNYNAVTIWHATGIVYSACLNSCLSSNCADFNLMNSPIGDYNNDSIYPIGSTLLNSGNIKIIKTKTGSWSAPGYFEQTTLNSVSSSQIFFHGYLTFDVSSTSYSCRELNIDGTAEKIIIGNDTIATTPGFNPYAGNGFVVDTLAGGGYIVKGTFNAVTIWIPTGLLNSLCVSSCANSSSCIDYRNLIGTSWPGNTGYNNDSLYPAGSIILSAGGVKIVKTYTTGNWNPPYNTYFTASTDTTFDVNGYITLDVSASTFSCKKLTFTSLYGRPSPFIVDGDTIPYSANPYSGNGFTMNAVGNTFTVSGSFNSISLFAPNLGLGDICLEDCSVASSGCLDFRNLIGTSWPGGTGYNDDVLYPAGSTILSAGDVKIVKTHPYGNWNPPLLTYFAFGTDTTITGDGYMTIDVSSSTYPCKQLNFSTIASTLIINGDTINNFGANSSYSGSGYNIIITNSFYKDVVVTGNFNSVILAGPNLTIGSVCLDSCVTPPCNNFAGFTFTVTPNGVVFTNTSSSTSTSANQFQWDFGDGNYSGDNDPIHAYASPGTYYVCLTIVDFSCPTNPTFQFCDTVIIGGCSGGHRIITPNNDGEADDVFVPSGSKIYDRNGFMVKSVKQDMNWKGDDNSNRPLPMGYYTITCGNGDGVFHVTIVK